MILNVNIVERTIIPVTNVCKATDSIITLIVFNVLTRNARNATLIINLVKFANKNIPSI